MPPAVLPASAAAERGAATAAAESTTGPAAAATAPLRGLIAAAKRAEADGVSSANLRAFCVGREMPLRDAEPRAWEAWSAELKAWSDEGAPPLLPWSSKLASGGCTINETALCGITLKQLRAMYAQACEACRAQRWRSYDEASDSCGTGGAERIEPDALTLYELVHSWIEPQTETRKCSMVELLADGPQPPRYFVSHWWGEPVKDFIACVAEHAHDHRHVGVDEDTPYWIARTRRATMLPGCARFVCAHPRLHASQPRAPSVPPPPRARTPRAHRSAHTQTTSTPSSRSWRAA